MPRRAPDGVGVTEHRITFGNYERQFVTEIKTDLENAAKIATVSAVALPIATVAGLGLLGYGLMKGGQAIGKGLNEFSFMDWETPDIVQDVVDGAGKAKWFIPGYFALQTRGWTILQRAELAKWIYSNGKMGKSYEQIKAEIFAVQQGGGGGDF